jgi:hypothetical protein
MGQHAKRFDAVTAPKGSGLRAVVDQLKTVADTAEEWFDPNSAEVVGAMMRFEQGLALLSTAPAHPEAGEPAKEKKPRTAGGREAATPKDSDDAKNVGDTPGNGAEGSGAVESS